MTKTALALLLLAAACDPAHGPMMAPFQDCLGCHSSSGDAKAWTVAGTWRKGAEVAIVDADGKTVTMVGNEVGNFYTREPLRFPYAVYVDGKAMHDPLDATKVAEVQYGGCNLCHRAEEVTLTFDATMLPGSDCLSCHRPGGMSETAFSAAGTFPPPQWPEGTQVTVAGQSTTTNAVGNFYITTPIAGSPPAASFSSPQAAIVAGSSMEDGTTDGSCNRCHVNGKARDED